MDTQLIKEFGTAIGCFRLRTVRQKRRMQYEDFDKQLRRLDAEQSLLWKKKQNLGWEPLIPAVQKGWKRFFVLREDVAKSKDAAFFEGILQKINTYAWSYRKDFKVKKRKRGRKIYVVKDQQLLRPYLWQWQKLAFTEIEKQFFYPVWETGYDRKPVLRYVFREPWRFELRVRPNMIDKIRVKDNELEQRLDEIHNYLERSDYSKRLNKIKDRGRYKRHRDERKWERNPFRHQSLTAILNAALIE